MAKPALDPEVLDALRRNSGLTLSGDGVWSYQASKVPHPRVQALFHQGLVVNADSEVELHVGRTWCYVRCETVARFVDGVAIEADSFQARLRHGPTVAAGRPPNLALGPDERLYLWLEGQHVAVLTRSAHQQLVGHLEPAEEDPEAIRLRIGEAVWPVPILASIPEPGASRPG